MGDTEYMTDTSEGRAAATALTINCEKCASGINGERHPVQAQLCTSYASPEVN